MLDRFEHFIVGITEIDLYWHRIAASAMKEYKLKGNYAIYFTKLLRSPNGLTAAELTSICGKDKADVSRDTNILIHKGLMKRLSNGTNTYRSKIVLTDEGTSLACNIVEKVTSAVELAGLDKGTEDIIHFYNMLDEITEKMRQLSVSDFK